MKRFIAISTVLISVVFLGSCAEKEDELLEILPETLITMENLDDYMFRDDVQYVDLRNYQASFRSGYIKSFEQIPFFDYLDYRVFDRDGGYDFSPDQLLNSSELERLFEKDKAILLYADGCIRSGYLKDALNHLGFERVYVIGGFYEYLGDYRIDGDGYYDIGNTFYVEEMDELTNIIYLMYGDFDVANNIVKIRFDIIDSEGKTYRGENYSDDTDYNDMLTILEEYIVDSIYNFNNLTSDVEDLENSDIGDIPGVDWTKLGSLIDLFETQFID